MRSRNRLFLTSSLVLLFAIRCWAGESDEGARHLKKGLKFHNKGLLVEAIEEYSRAIQFNPKLEKAWLMRGDIFFRADDFERARSDLTRAIDLRPDNGKALYLRGIANRNLREFEQAESDLTQAVGFHRDSPQVYIERGQVRILRNELAEAVSDYDRAERILTDVNSAMEVVGREIDEFQRYEAIYGSVEIRRDLFDPHLSRAANHYFFRSDFDSPESLYSVPFQDNLRSWANRVGSTLQKPLADVYIGRGAAKWFMNDQEGGFEDFRRLLRADRTAIGKGIFHYLKGDFESARKSLMDSLRGSPRQLRDYAEIWLWLTSVHLGELKEANARLRDHFLGKRSKGRADFGHRIAQFLLQEITLPELFEFATVDDPSTTRGWHCEAAFYSAQVALLLKEREESAKVLLNKCLATGVWNFVEYQAATIQKIILSERLSKTIGVD